MMLRKISQASFAGGPFMLRKGGPMTLRKTSLAGPMSLRTGTPRQVDLSDFVVDSISRIQPSARHVQTMHINDELRKLLKDTVKSVFFADSDEEQREAIEAAVPFLLPVLVAVITRSEHGGSPQPEHALRLRAHLSGVTTGQSLAGELEDVKECLWGTLTAFNVGAP